MTREKLIVDKWNRWFDAILDDVIGLHYYRMIYKDVSSMVDANPEIQKPSSFYNFLRNGYITLTLIIIRRQVTRDKRSISLARLLSEICARPQEISRKHFHRLYAGLGRSEARIDEIFEASGVEAGRDFIDPHSVQTDLDTLTDMTKTLHKYTDKRVAHIDARTRISAIPTFGDLDDAIDALARVCAKYSVLLRGNEIKRFEPILQKGWKEIFRIPWIVDELGAQAQTRTRHVS